MCFTVAKCCFCIDLRKGIIALASICLVLDLLLLILMSCLTYFISEAEKYSWTELEPEERELFFGFIAALFYLTAAGAVISSLAVFLDITLLAGAIKARRNVLHGWKTAYAVLYVFSLLIYGANVTLDFAYHSAFYGTFFSVCILLQAGLMLYLLVVVNSYCRQLALKYGDGGLGPNAGRVYRKEALPPGQVTYCHADGSVTAPGALPSYTVLKY